MPREWRFLDFVDRGGENQIRRWLNEQPPKVKAHINALIRNLAILDRPFTRQDKVGLLRKPPCAGEQLIELIAKIDKVQYRPIGWYGPEAREVTLLLGAIERGGELDPRNACHIAKQRKNLVKGDRGYVRDHQFD